MANQVELLADWMVNKSAQLGWTLDQCRAVTLKQVQNQLPAQYAGKVSEVLFGKAKVLMLRRVFQDQLETLRNNAGIWTTIKAIFPNATVTIENGYRKRIIIDLLGTVE